MFMIKWMRMKEAGLGKWSLEIISPCIPLKYPPPQDMWLKFLFRKTQLESLDNPLLSKTPGGCL